MNRSSLTTILGTIGTSPEAIKMAPLIRALKSTPWARCRVVCTAQHRDLVAPILKFFENESDINLDSMRPGQSPGDLCSRLVESLRGIIASVRPDMVLARGDTTSVLAAAWASFHHRFHLDMSRADYAGVTVILHSRKKRTGWSQVI